MAYATVNNPDTVAKVIAIVSSAQTEDEVIKKVKSLNL